MKLVGTYRGTVVDVDRGFNHNNNLMLNVKFEFTDELLNGEWVPLNFKHSSTKMWSLKPNPGKSGKSAAMITVQQVREAFDFTGSFDNLGDLMFKQAELVCPEHDGKYTKIEYVNNLNRKNVKGGGMKLKEIEGATLDEIKNIFDSIK